MFEEVGIPLTLIRSPYLVDTYYNITSEHNSFVIQTASVSFICPSFLRDPRLRELLQSNWLLNTFMGHFLITNCHMWAQPKVGGAILVGGSWAG